MPPKHGYDGHRSNVQQCAMLLGMLCGACAKGGLFGRWSVPTTAFSKGVVTIHVAAAPRRYGQSTVNNQPMSHGSSRNMDCDLPVLVPVDWTSN